ncbi:hypothetical protein C1H46_013425 [Malus baccata]|uniref:Uncharacterized protein n=1 Tax=Malus baccata TaxID=106549 RepID=A0A540MQ37_MALBA|nr:hypothetical protein C1H46_013425 [Malus baccata]
MLELAPGLQPRRCQRFGRLTATTTESTRFKVIFSCHLENRDGLEQSSLAWLQKEYQIPLFPTGPLHKTVPSPSTSLLKEDQSCMSWLDKQAHNSVIHVSLGSTTFMDSKN